MAAGQTPPPPFRMKRDAANEGAAHRSLADLAYEQLLAMIVRGEYPAGGKLPSEHALSQRLHVSRPVLRQALQQLRVDHLIVSKQGSGSYVTRQPDSAVLEFAPIGSIADIQRVFEFRAAIEGEAAFHAAARRSDADLARIKSALMALDICVQEGKLGTDADEAFHSEICKASQNDYFLTARQSMKPNILKGLTLTRSLSLTKPKARLDLVQREHHAIFDAIKAKDQTAAREAMRAHIENARSRLFESNMIVAT